MEIDINEDFEDALSLCDLPLSDQGSDEFLNSSSTDLDLFEFSTSSSSSSSSSIDTLLFCGKFITSKSSSEANDLNKNQSANKNLTSSSFNANIPPRGKNLRCSSSRNNGCRKQKVMIGLAKIPSTMELNDLRERHNRRTISPPPVFTAVEKGGESAVVSGRGSRRWGLLRPFRCRAGNMGSLLATSSSSSSSSIGCLPIARPCFD